MPTRFSYFDAPRLIWDFAWCTKADKYLNFCFQCTMAYLSFSFGAPRLIQVFVLMYQGLSEFLFLVHQGYLSLYFWCTKAYLCFRFFGAPKLIWVQFWCTCQLDGFDMQWLVLSFKSDNHFIKSKQFCITRPKTKQEKWLGKPYQKKKKNPTLSSEKKL